MFKVSGSSTELLSFRRLERVETVFDELFKSGKKRVEIFTWIIGTVRFVQDYTDNQTVTAMSILIFYFLYLQ